MPANNKKYTLQHLQQHAEIFGGKCSSISYSTPTRKYIWVCKLGHKWAARWKVIKYDNTWCPVCAKNSKPDIKELQCFAINNQGFLLSSVYVKCEDKLLWQCKAGHKWKACWDNIKQGRWCPKCSTFKTELQVKTIFEETLNIVFNKHRFYYDIGNKHRYYEVDGYNEEYKIAFEYNGYQHYIYPNRFHKTQNIFYELQQRDIDKRNYCAKLGIHVITIPHTESTNLKQYIEREIKLWQLQNHSLLVI